MTHESAEPAAPAPVDAVRGLPNLLEFDPAALEDFVCSLGEPAFRGRQLWQWLWQKGETSFAAMTNLSKSFRAKLSENACADLPHVLQVSRSSDATFKFLLRLRDKELVECVLIPEKDHYTLCLSTQVGCAMGCAFCTTGRMGLTRNMSAGEIASQVVVARRFLQRENMVKPLRNIVYMGMGEPLHNTQATLGSLRIVTNAQGLDFSSRRVTVSSVGLPQGLKALGECGLASLAISLHAPTQELREQLMPRAAGAVPLEKLMRALDAYPLKPRQRITYEYILLAGVNDSLTHARQLVKLLGQRKAKVNLIAYNPGPAQDGGAPPFRAPAMETIEAFENALRDRGMTVLLRKSKGQDIAAACGQLKAAGI